ncbi:MAG TPA: cation acetate symporter, partial [Streptomyces sp.]|nr:cation acetate symporter [Streptomyces sp.]
AYTEAATVVLPALAFTLLRRGFALRGLRWIVYGGTLVTLVLLALSPGVTGSPHSLFPDADWNIFPLHSPGVISIPVAFLLGALGARRKPERPGSGQVGRDADELVGAGGARRP